MKRCLSTYSNIFRQHLGRNDEIGSLLPVIYSLDISWAALSWPPQLMLPVIDPFMLNHKGLPHWPHPFTPANVTPGLEPQVICSFVSSWWCGISGPEHTDCVSCVKLAVLSAVLAPLKLDAVDADVTTRTCCDGGIDLIKSFLSAAAALNTRPPEDNVDGIFEYTCVHTIWVYKHWGAIAAIACYALI